MGRSLHGCPVSSPQSRGGGRRRKNSRGLGRPGRRSRRRAGRRQRTAVESPSINFHARIIIGKLESWLPDSRFVSPNESERVGAQRLAAAGGGGSFSLYAASSKSSMLRRAIIIVSLASFPPRGCRAGQQIHADRDRGAESWAPLCKRGESDAAGGGVLPSAPKRGPFANCGRLRAPPVPPPAAQLRALAARPPARPSSLPPHPRLTAAGAGSSPAAGAWEKGPQVVLRELWPAFCETHTGLQKHTGPAQGELLRPAASFSPSFPLTPHPSKIPVASVIKCLIPSPTLSLHWCIIRSGKACFQANRPNKCYYWDSASPGCTIVTRALANLV
ncbi:uncharacterized protein LOC132354055 [Balaenoptera ricei]|uniref:uncharacterized protein LOC132354055 n=1 Tax=Balaenoptera ricei TaxID=2746895 RepID=UPI0028BE1574|nr:uncharacterized protein LOC132354055 [Balaenoptera ricei]